MCKNAQNPYSDSKKRLEFVFKKNRDSKYHKLKGILEGFKICGYS